MKILFDDQAFCWQEFGGISRYFYELATRVDKADGFTASVLAPLHVNRYLTGGGVCVKGIRIPKLRNSGRILSALNRLPVSLQMRLSKPDVVHETFCYRHRSLAPRGCPAVLTVFDMIHEKFPEHFLTRDHTSQAKRAAVKRADRVICISASTQRDLIEFFNVPPEKTEVIHLGFSLTGQNDVSLLQTESRPFLLYVGLRGRYKNFISLLKAYASSSVLRKSFSLVVFGGGKFSGSEQEQLRASGVSDSVKQISGDDRLLAALYKHASAFIYPSTYEGFGIPPLEAMSFDCPVICSNASSIPEVVGDAGCFFDPHSVDSIAHSIEKVVSSSDLRGNLIQRGRERIKQFSWDKTAEKTLEVYRTLKFTGFNLKS